MPGCLAQSDAASFEVENRGCGPNVIGSKGGDDQAAAISPGRNRRLTPYPSRAQGGFLTTRNRPSAGLAAIGYARVGEDHHRRVLQQLLWPYKLVETWNCVDTESLAVR